MNDTSGTNEGWLTLSEAARRLNVHPTTLRRWASNGEIPVMVTPGGHRRFAKSDVDGLARRRHTIRRFSDVEKVWANEAIAQTRKDMTGPDQQQWLTKLDADSREKHRRLGQRLMGIMLQYLSDDHNGQAMLDEARTIGLEYGESARRMGLPLADALKASMFFRDALVETTVHLPEKVLLRQEARARLLQKINALLNTVQLAVAEVYDEDNSNRLPGA